MKRILTAATAAFLLLMMCVSVPVLAGSDDFAGTEYPVETETPFTPSGAGTVIDNATDEDGKEFYTIMTPDEAVFYLVIDKQRSAENVYFLNAVTVDDLMSLAAPSQTQTAATPTPTPSDSTPTETPVPTEQMQGGNNGTLMILIVLAGLGGGAYWYFKIYRQKQGTDGYDQATDENYMDGWDEDSEGEAAEADALPWDEDGESEGEDE